MTKTDQRSLRFTPETVRKTKELAKILGPVKPLSMADVVTVAIDDLYKRKTAKEKTSKNS